MRGRAWTSHFSFRVTDFGFDFCVSGVGPRVSGAGLEEGSAITETKFLIDNLLVQILLIIDIILVNRPCAMGV